MVPFLILLLLVVSIVFPLAVAWRLVALREPAFGRWLIAAADALVFFALIWLVARWDIGGIHTRRALLVIVLAALAISLFRQSRHPAPAAAWTWTVEGGRIASLVLFGVALAYVLSGFFPQQGARDLALPLSGGTFVVGQGGGVGLLNHHSGHPAQDHAVDFTAVSVLGIRAPGLLPSELDAYTIMGAAIVSPCAGEVREAQDGLPDLVPPQMDPVNAAGNHVIVACDGLLVELAHLRNGSVAVSPGDIVEVNDVLGAVGNSGNTSEPHLHVHAVDEATGMAVPLRFDGVTPVRNTVYRR